ILEFEYDDQAPWPVAADAGYSLVLIAPETRPDPRLPSNWRASTRPGGNPGEPDGDGVPKDPAGDADGNGERDLLDYVLGHDLGLAPVPLRVHRLPDPSGGPQELRLSHGRSLQAPRAELGIAYSFDLVTWQDAASFLAPVSSEPHGTGREWVTWRVLQPLRDEPRVHFRATARWR
ncbi:MAG: hypothetical protein JNL97_03515, partial [Verrucomicrobiales bacterium]|nr:hypothetical protein [Verrucomicrobiales bacterium]